jgi:hypothetical protein
MEHVEPDRYEMGLTDHRRSPEPKIKHSLAILQDLRPWGPCVVYVEHNRGLVVIPPPRRQQARISPITRSG